MYANRGGACLLPEMFGPMGHERIHCHAYINIYSTYSYWYGYTLVYACTILRMNQPSWPNQSSRSSMTSGRAQPLQPASSAWTPARVNHQLLSAGGIYSVSLSDIYIYIYNYIYIYIFDVYSEILSHISHTNWHFIWHPT